MGNISSKNPPKYNQVFKKTVFKKTEILIEELKEDSIYNDICKHYNLGNKFERLEKYFTNLNLDDLQHMYCLDFYKVIEPSDVIIMKVFERKYLNEYQRINEKNNKKIN